MRSKLDGLQATVEAQKQEKEQLQSELEVRCEYLDRSGPTVFGSYPPCSVVQLTNIYCSVALKTLSAKHASELEDVKTSHSQQLTQATTTAKHEAGSDHVSELKSLRVDYEETIEQLRYVASFMTLPCPNMFQIGF